MGKNENRGFELTVKEVANLIDETPNVVRNWMKELKPYIPLKKNESGYNVFDEQALEIMKQIKDLHRNRNFSIKQIEHYFATDGETYIIEPEKDLGEKLAEELNEIKSQLQQQQEFNKLLIDRLDKQNDYIHNVLVQRDQKLLESIREMQEQKLLEIAATKEEQQKGFFSKLFKR